MSRCLYRTTLTLFLLLMLGRSSAAQTTQPIDAASLPDECFLFSSFRGNGDGLHFAWSADGLKWSALNDDKAYLTPTIGGKLMRDPCILQGPDGTFHLVWTTGWWDKTIGYASSKDLIHWSEQKAIPVMEHEASAKNSWAPEIAYDPATKDFVIFWATTIPGRFQVGESTGDRAQDGTMLNHRIYATTTKDFVTFSPTKLFFDPGFSVIDSSILKTNDKFMMIFKDETLTPPRKHLRVASSDNLEGPYTVVSEPFTPPGQWVEGPSLFQVGSDYYCYFDMYIAGRYGAMRTKDFKTWEDLTPKLNFNVRNIRHGTAFKVSKAQLLKLHSSEAASASK